MIKPIARWGPFLLVGFVLGTSTLAAGGERAGPPEKRLQNPTTSLPRAETVGIAAGFETGSKDLRMFLPSSEVVGLTKETLEASNKADSAAPVEVVEERYPSGALKIRREVTLDQQGNYILHGQWEMWDESGSSIAKGKYRNNRRHGTWTRIHTGSDAALFSEVPYNEYPGPFTSQAAFQDGRLHGTWTICDAEQRKISEWEYTNGVLHGLSVWNFASGKTMREATFVDGLVDGYLRQYDHDGKVVIDETYQQGRKLAPKVEYDESKRKISEGIYLHARFVIDSPDDWWNAKPVKYTPVGQDVKHGCWTAWHPNGQKRVEGIYENDLPEGEFTWWYPNGQQAVVGNYRNGQPHGAWTWWHENAQKATNGQYIRGEMTGAWVYWKEDGQLQEKSDFSENTQFAVAEPEGSSEAGESKIDVSRAPAGGTSIK